MAKCERKDEFLASDITGLNLEIGYAELRMVEEATDKIEVVANLEEEKLEKYQCEVTDEILRVKAGNVDVRISIFGDDKTFHKGEAAKDIVTITVPYGMKFNEMKLELGAGTAKLSNPSNTYTYVKTEVGAGKLMAEGMQVEEVMEIEVGAGTAELKDFCAKKANLECGVGIMRMRGSVEGDIDVNCGVGTIEMDLDAVENDYNYHIDCAVGAVVINGSKRGGLFSSRSSVSNPNAKGTINLECGVGKIELMTRKRIAEA